MSLVVDRYEMGPVGTNCYVVRAERGAAEAVVVDPGGDSTDLRLDLARSGARCRAIFVTHADADHVAGVADLAEGTGAAICAPPRDAMPSDCGKQHKARLFELRAYLRLEREDRAGAVQDLEMATRLWPVTANPAMAVLDKLYAEASDQGARQAMWARIKR